jgi:hypothetical protein
MWKDRGTRNVYRTSVGKHLGKHLLARPKIDEG